MKRSRFIQSGLVGLSVFLLLFNLWIPYAAGAAGNGGQGGAGTPVFKDIRSHWAYNEIMELAALNIISGFGDGTFRPNDEITREQFLKILVELSKFPAGSGIVPFRDVDPKRWSAPYIATGIEQGILLAREYPDGLFKPGQPITRHEMAVWIARALRLAPQLPATKLSALKDQADIRSHRDLIEAALQSGIINGYPDGTFRGGNKSTRAEASAMAVRALRHLRNPPSPSDQGNTRKIVEYLPNVKIGKSTRYEKIDDRTWVIRDPDLSLRPGDVFVMPPNEQYYGGIAKKVVSVREENGSLVVTTSVPKVREVFARLDVHTTEAIDPGLLTPADPSIQIIRNETSSKPAEVKAAALTLPCFVIRMDNANHDGLILSASMNFCNLGVDADIGLDVDVDWFDVDLDFYARLVLLGDVTTNVNVKANRALTRPVYIPLTAPYYVPVFTGVFIKGQFFLKIEPDFRASLEIQFENRFHLEEGFSISSSGGFQTIDKTTNTATLQVNSGANAALSAGPSAQLTLTLLDIAYAGIELYPGIRAGYYRYADQGRCDEILVDAFLKLNAVAGYDVWVASGNVSRTLIDASFPLFDYELNCPLPTVPGNLRAQLVREIFPLSPLTNSLIDRISVDLSWTPVKGATSYRVKRADAPGGPYETIRSNLSSTSYRDTSTARGKTYYYQVVAVNAYGEGAPTQVLPVQIDDLPPPRPKNLKATREGSNVKLEWDRMNGIVFSGDRSSGPFGTTLTMNGVTYNVKRSDKERGGLQTIATDLTEPSYIDTTAKFDEDYLYVVTAKDRYGESGYSNFVFVKKGQLPVISDRIELIEIPLFLLLVTPPAPEQLTAEGRAGEVVLTWSPVEEAAGYHVKRASAANGTYETIASSVSGTTFTDTGVTNGNTYYYKVTAVNDLGFESADSPVASATPTLFSSIILMPNLPLIDLLRIAAPKNFQAVTDVGSGRIMLSWDAVGGAAGYNVWRAESQNGPFAVIAAKISGTSYTDTTAAIGKTYYYKVTAVDQFGNEGNATPVKSATPSRGIR